MTEAYHLNALPPGATLQEYEILHVLGAGSFGIVYLAKGKFLDDLVAIKEYLPRELAMRAEGSSVTPTSSADETNFQWGRQKFLEEARLLWQLAKPQPHPNVIAVRRFFEQHDTAYMVMDYEQGGPLSERLESAGRLAEKEVWSLLHPLLNGLEMIHAAGITHRDIKPGNIFVRADGSPVLLDFGAARLALAERTQSAFNTMSPAYAATEQLMGSDNVGPWTDIYGLGATLYRAVTGRLPQSPLERLVEERHRSAVELAGDRYSRTLLAGIDAALALRAEDRPQSIAEWRTILLGRPGEFAEDTAIVSKAAAGPEPAPPPPAGGPPEPGAGRGGYRIFVAAALVLLIGAAGIGLGAYYLSGQPEEGGGKAGGEVADDGPSPGQAPLASDVTLQQRKQEEARQLAEIEAKRRAEVEAQRAAEAEARRLVEREAERKAEEERRRLAEAEARRLAELEAKRNAEEDAKRRAEAEARRQAEAKGRRLAEAEAARQAEETHRLAEEESRRAAEEARRHAEEDARRRAEEASIAKAEETDRRLSQVVAVEESLFAAKNANVRSAPSADSSKLAMLPAGSEVQVTGKLQDGTWYRVDLTDGTDGFVWAPLLADAPPAAATSSTAEPAQAARRPDALPPTTGSDANSATAGGGAATRASGDESKMTQEAVVRPVPDPAETRSRITELQTYIDRNWRDAETAFREFAARKRLFGPAERFRRVISFDGISYDPPEYVISVRYAYCYMKVRCQNLIGAGAFAARFDDGKLTFLGESDAATN